MVFDSQWASEISSSGMGVVHIITDQGISGYGEAESAKP
jgi:L-alanine-DL-glutamate epimerase-like enolase superfamily enzyme